MRHSKIAALMAALGLGGCVSAAPVQFSDDNPASPKAAEGFVTPPSSLEDYKTLDDFASRAAADATGPAMDHSGHNMPGMNMPGMQMPGTQSKPEAAPAASGATEDTAVPHMHR